MSGFIAIINTDGAPVDRELLKKLTASLHFRGPDCRQEWIDGSVGFGHTLFRTTDEAQFEKQPASLDGKVWIVGCIRVDGREELINKLGLKRKIRLSQTPDSELILHAYKAWGNEFLKHLIGDFAFVLWDGHNRKLFCARDHFGMRQLYYSQVGNELIISNSMYCLHQHSAIPTQLNDRAIGDFLIFGDQNLMDKAQTSFAKIKSLPPAHFIVLKDKTIYINRYWDVPIDIPSLRYRKEEEYIEHFQEIFKEAISDRLRTPKVVISLSGGMDSSSIAAMIREIQQIRTQTIDLNAVTVLYDSIHPSDERYYVDLVLDHLKLSTHYFDGGKFPLMSPPVLTTSPIELYQPALWHTLVSKGAELSRVMITGDAGDNLLIYTSKLEILKETNPFTLLTTIYRLRILYGAYPGFGLGLLSKFNRFLGKSTLSNVPFPYPDWLNPDFEKEYDLQNRWSEMFSLQQPTSAHHYSNLRTSLNQPNWNTDDIYMHSDITLPEKRDPFLDKRLVEFIASLPTFPWLFKKHILRESMIGRLPNDIIKRPKTILGSIHSSLLKQSDIKWINNWQATPELNKFINRGKIQLVNNKQNDEAESYINIRPMLLNCWIRELRK